MEEEKAKSIMCDTFEDMLMLKWEYREYKLGLKAFMKSKHLRECCYGYAYPFYTYQGFLEVVLPSCPSTMPFSPLLNLLTYF